MPGILHAIRHVALAALILRAMLPTGWMPDARAGLTICSLDSGISSSHLGTVHHDGTPSDHGKTSHEECPFAAAAHFAPPPQNAALALPVQHAFAAATDQARAVLIAARFSPGAPRAPPRFA